MLNKKYKNHKNIILFGAPGAGKSTQVEMLKQAGLDFSLISLGQTLRQMAKKNTPLAKRIKETLRRGEFLDELLISEIVKDQLRDIDKNKIIILDGYPRTLHQVREADKIFKELGLQLPILICIKITLEEAIRRLEGRRVCSKCQRNYHIDNLGKNKEKCPQCGGKLIQRSDDKKQSIKKRFELFDMQLEIIQHYYQKRKRYFEVNGMGDKEETHREIMGIIND